MFLFHGLQFLCLICLLDFRILSQRLLPFLQSILVFRLDLVLKFLDQILFFSYGLLSLFSFSLLHKHHMLVAHDFLLSDLELHSHGLLHLVFLLFLAFLQQLLLVCLFLHGPLLGFIPLSLDLRLEGLPQRVPFVILLLL